MKTGLLAVAFCLLALCQPTAISRRLLVLVLLLLEVLVFELLGVAEVLLLV